ncbi:MAG: hypothetical protein LBW85_11265 [Deltaproteobacteria bacterium]|jgi:hypothetical protein|nr:hypothetical protein [Deltaproteobacteria bacterium]
MVKLCQAVDAAMVFMLNKEKLMRSIIFEELRPDEIFKAGEYLKERLQTTNIVGLFWMLLPEEILTGEQKDLSATAGPYKISVDLGKDKIRFELLVRAEEITNIGGGYADNSQLEYIHAFAVKLAEELELKTCL